MKLSNIRIPVRIAVACLLPLVAFTGFAVTDLFEKRAVVANTEAIAAVAEVAPTIAALVHELQRERGATAGFVNSKGKAFAEVMRNQRPLTDKAVQVWSQRLSEFSKSSAGTKLARNLEAANSSLSELGRTRTSVDAFAVDSQKATEFYTGAISGLIAAVDAISEMSDDGKIIRQATALTSLIRRKEYGGQGRALGAAAFTSGQFTPQGYQAFMRTQVLGDTHAAAFRRNASQSQIDYVNGILTGPMMDSMVKMRQVAANAPFTNSMGGVTGQQWFDVASKYIDSLKTAEDRIASDFTATVRAAAAQARWGFWGLLLLALGLLAVTGAVVWFVVRSITRPVGQLVGTMATLAQGKNDIEVPGTERGDELGHMARAVLVFRDAAVEKIRLEAASADAEKASEVERQRNEAARAAAAAQVKHVVNARRRRPRATREGRAHLPDHRRVRRRIQESAGRLQRGHRPVAGDHRRDRNLGA